MQTSVPWAGHSGTATDEPKRMNDQLDPAIFSNLAELLDQSQYNSTETNTPYDFMGALEPSAPSSTHVTANKGPSLLTQRLQHHGGQNYAPEMGIGEALPGPNDNSSHTAMPSPGSFLSNSNGMMPTHPQSFPSSFGYPCGQPSGSTPTQLPLWPLPESAKSYVETPMTTPSGSEYGLTSPADVSVVSSRLGHRLTLSPASSESSDASPICASVWGGSNTSRS